MILKDERFFSHNCILSSEFDWWQILWNFPFDIPNASFFTHVERLIVLLQISPDDLFLILKFPMVWFQTKKMVIFTEMIINAKNSFSWMDTSLDLSGYIWSPNYENSLNLDNTAS